jgi:hypothetical protein
MKRHTVLFALFALLMLLGLTATAAAGEIRGKVKQVDPDRLEFVVERSSGEVIRFQMDEDAQVLINNKDATLAELEVGDHVNVIHRQDGGNMMAIEVRCKRP